MKNELVNSLIGFRRKGLPPFGGESGPPVIEHDRNSTIWLDNVRLFFWIYFLVLWAAFINSVSYHSHVCNSNLSKGTRPTLHLILDSQYLMKIFAQNKQFDVWIIKTLYCY